MNYKLVVNLFMIVIIIILNTIYVQDYDKSIHNNIWISNLNEKNIQIKINHIKVNNQKIKLDNIYEASAIFIMEVENKGSYDIELSNIDIYPYQNNELVKYFVSTSDENINGFRGSLKPNEKTLVKVGITLNNTKDPLRLSFSNIESYNNERVNKVINIK